jgi:hypothetical protein
MYNKMLDEDSSCLSSHQGTNTVDFSGDVMKIPIFRIFLRNEGESILELLAVLVRPKK